MPRSFLVKTHSSHRVPNYGQLERQRETNGACSACGGLVVPLVLPDKAAPSTPGDPPRPWDFTSVVAHVSLPLPTFLCNEEARGASGPDPLEVSPADPRAGRAPGAPLRDSLKHLSLPPLLALPTCWPPVLGADGAQAPGHLPGAERAPRTPAALARHQQLHCHLQAQRCFTCKFCDKEYGSLGALKMHIRTHTLPCLCPVCGKAFSRPWLLQGHIRTHTGEKPYTCPHCSRAFADRSNLRAHLQTHSDAKKYRCKRCAKTFSRVALLVRHEESGCRGP
ncbi:zinc finger protein SNAI3 [Physeter macrocephalus]|uniref:Zinc finger protein SNAI3 n=1 Tax=Physeter macrocephalus TaxID=9755 RepID=A0A2Y9FKT6_PHYMC|nr:zinc finger protein SNAI3 [Physeter catodon]|eukprot:XP_007125571.2 zinc finger protein SNAI3 [Physeter catodon]